MAVPAGLAHEHRGERELHALHVQAAEQTLCSGCPPRAARLDVDPPSHLVSSRCAQAMHQGFRVGRRRLCSVSEQNDWTGTRLLAPPEPPCKREEHEKGQNGIQKRGIFAHFVCQSRWSPSQSWSTTKLVDEERVHVAGRPWTLSGRGGRSRDRAPRQGINPSSRPAINHFTPLAERVAESAQ